MSGESAGNAEAKDWHSSKHIAKRARHLLEHPDDEIPSDVTFLVGDGQNEPQKMFKCHKFILAMVSSMFQAMFFGSFPETEGTIKIPDVTPVAFQLMLRYAYGENIEMEDVRLEHVLDTLYCAKKYLITKLERSCRVHVQMCMTLSGKDACSVFQQASQMDEDNLATLALAKIALFTPIAMEQNALFRLSFDCFKRLLDYPCLNAKESQVYQYVRRWVEHNMWVVTGSALRDAFGSLLYSIRFPLFSPTELLDGPVADGVLTGEEGISVLQFLLSKVKPTLPFLTTPRIPLVGAMMHRFELVITPAGVECGHFAYSFRFLYVRPDLAPQCCAFLHQLIVDKLHIRIASCDNEYSGKTVALPAGVPEERNILSHSIKAACWFEWDIQDGGPHDIRIGTGRKPSRWHSAVFGIAVGKDRDKLKCVPFDLWNDKCIRGVSNFRIYENML